MDICRHISLDYGWPRSSTKAAAAERDDEPFIRAFRVDDSDLQGWNVRSGTRALGREPMGSIYASQARQDEARWVLHNDEAGFAPDGAGSFG